MPTTSFALPLKAVPASFAVYYVASLLILRGADPSSVRARLKALSAVHAAVATPVVLLALAASPLRTQVSVSGSGPTYLADGNLDDSLNPIIMDQSDVANAITAWETGYLLYDTWAMIHHASATWGSRQKRFTSSACAVARKQPVLLTHHLLLSTSFLYLQYYIARGRERGIWIIVAFLLMNASNPLMHARWYFRKSGKDSKLLDIAFAVVFALSRFGTVTWVFKRYAAHHRLGAGEVYRKLRAPCQLGTGTLVGLNAIWWLALVQGIVRRAVIRSGR